MFAHFSEKISQEKIPYLLQKAAEIVEKLDQEEHIWSIELHLDNRPRKTTSQSFAPCCMIISFQEKEDDTEKQPMLYYFNVSTLQWELKK